MESMLDNEKQPKHLRTTILITYFRINNTHSRPVSHTGRHVAYIANGHGFSAQVTLCVLPVTGKQCQFFVSPPCWLWTSNPWLWAHISPQSRHSMIYSCNSESSDETGQLCVLSAMFSSDEIDISFFKCIGFPPSFLPIFYLYEGLFVRNLDDIYMNICIIERRQRKSE